MVVKIWQAMSGNGRAVNVLITPILWLAQTHGGNGLTQIVNQPFACCAAERSTTAVTTSARLCAATTGETPVSATLDFGVVLSPLLCTLKPLDADTLT